MKIGWEKVRDFDGAMVDLNLRYWRIAVKIIKSQILVLFFAAYSITIWVVILLNFNHKDCIRYDIYFVSFIKLSKLIPKSNCVHWKSKSKRKSVKKFSSPVQIPIFLLRVVLSCFHRNTDVITICLLVHNILKCPL